MTQDDFCTIFTETNRHRQIPLSLRGLEPWEQPHSGSLSNWGSASGPRRPQRATGNAQGTRGPDSSPPPPPPSASCARAAYCPSTAINDDDFNNGSGGGASSFPSAPALRPSVRPPARDARAGQDRFRCFLPGLQVTFTPASRTTGIPSLPSLGASIKDVHFKFRISGPLPYSLSLKKPSDWVSASRGPQVPLQMRTSYL